MEGEQLFKIIYSNEVIDFLKGLDAKVKAASWNSSSMEPYAYVTAANAISLK